METALDMLKLLIIESHETTPTSDVFWVHFRLAEISSDERKSTLNIHRKD